LTGDEALREAWDLGHDDEGWSDEVMHSAEQLLPYLVESGYAETDEEAGTWAYTDAGLARADELGLG
jgi:hypothetical protein